MNPIIRNILVVIGAYLLGSIVNMGIITIGPSIIPVPEGVDPTDIESLKANMHLFKPINFVTPFLAHALGTLVGALIAAKFTTTQHLYFALGIGAFFSIGGIMVLQMLPHPTWYAVLDLGLAYLPMGWLGWKLSGNPKTAA